MGFGTSGSALVVFAALFIAMSTMYTSAGNSVERVTDARESAEDRHHTVQETGVDVVAATWNTTSSNLTIVVENTGETTLAVDRLDVVAEAEYLDSTAFERSEVDGRETTTWRPGERLVLEDADDLAGVAQTPDRVTLVTGPGIADTAPVTEVSA
jgi:archaellum component FlaF (FlaF/FlaG flagellin family)